MSKCIADSACDDIALPPQNKKEMGEICINFFSSLFVCSGARVGRPTSQSLSLSLEWPMLLHANAHGNIINSLTIQNPFII